jgi:hypothetical protein
VVFVLTVDQRRSRSQPDGVPQALEALNRRSADGGLTREFERTAGDEIQGVISSAEAVVDVVLSLVRTGTWNIGIGIGAAREPLPSSTRAGHGEVFVRARAGVERAKSAPQRLCVVGADDPRAERAASALILLAALLRRRSKLGWEAADMLSSGCSRAEAAQRLGVSPAAISYRLQAAGWAEEERGRDLAAALLAEADSEVTP